MVKFSQKSPKRLNPGKTFGFVTMPRLGLSFLLSKPMVLTGPNKNANAALLHIQISEVPSFRPINFVWIHSANPLSPASLPENNKFVNAHTLLDD